MYKRIPELNGLMDTVREGHGRLLKTKRADILEIIRQCLEEIHVTGSDHAACSNLLKEADAYFSQQKGRVAELESLQLLDGLVPQLWAYKDETVERMEALKKPAAPVKPVTTPVSGAPAAPAKPKKVIKTVYRQQFPSKTLESQADIDAYVERMRSYLSAMMKDCDGIKLS